MIEQDSPASVMPRLVKGVRIVTSRLVEQGIRTTGLWLVHLFCRTVLDRPLRRLSQITPSLFVGGQFGRRGKRILERWGIEAVVNLRAEFDDRAAALAPTHYLYLPTIDDQAPSMEALEEGVAFIQAQIKAGRKVYIHCASGVGRAPTLAVAYLVSTGLMVEQAWDMIRQVRPFIRPTLVQRRQVERFAQWWRQREQASPRE
ncbi:dual specificity protein phosphatase family protein [uncultured Thermanaerothrix sp.]|uniref:protein-tyrosine phosphatase family protein n=1 Tax=uncultured Thermanaerothrix sp. TaxID=1195149 RepID=UPI0026182CA9|nr:dual specificity protein phosphatase family protein [uncultured Thermanaerothrix sp.]